MIHAYTGNGKGKTTAAMGLALRAVGAGLKVCVIQFLKGRSAHSELKALKKAKVVRFKQAHPAFYPKGRMKSAAAALKRQAGKDFQKARKIAESGKFDIVIMDEVINLVSQNFLPEDDLVSLIDSMPKKTELVLTGRGASRRLIKRCDYATDMRLVRHPYYKGKKPRKGIEH